MLRDLEPLTSNCQRLVDLAVTIFSCFSAYYIKKYLLPFGLSGLSTEPNYYLLLMLAIGAWHISLNWVGMYNLYFRKHPFSTYLKTILKACCMGMTLLIVVIYFSHLEGISRLFMALFFCINLLGLIGYKFIVFMALRRFRYKAFHSQNILIVGSGFRAKEVIGAIKNKKNNQYIISACFDITDKNLGKPIAEGYQVTGRMLDLEPYLIDNIVDELIFAINLRLLKRNSNIIDLAETLGIKVRFIPDWELLRPRFHPQGPQIKFEEFLGIHHMSLYFTPPNEGDLLIKSVFDYTMAVFFIVVLSPVWLCIGLSIKLFSKGSILYTQERLGKNGRRFKVYKFRTMVRNADELLKELAEMNEADGPVFKIKKDPRIIPWVGTFLRETSLDELPQLINVLKGEMSLVGPRPPIPKEVDEYSNRQRRRLSVKPGMTCLWQIAPNRNDLTFEDWIRLDLEYIDTWSLSSDLWILILTARAVFTGAGR